MERAQVTRYLRIAVTALSLTACVLLIALWVRSYQFGDRSAMQLPRFSIKGLLITLAVVALWFATFNMPDPTNRGIRQEIRLCILLAILIGAGFAAAYSRGKRRAFWSGFFVAMLLGYWRFNTTIPNLLLVAESWSGGLLRTSASYSFSQMLTKSLWAALMLLFSSVVGVIVAAIYERNQLRK